MARDADWTGIHRHGSGWRAVVSQGRDRPPLKKHFPEGTRAEEMQAWRRDTGDTHRLKRKARRAFGIFAADARRYLALVRYLPTYADRVRDLQHWIDLFGDRPRDGIRASDIQAQRDRWLHEPRSRVDPRPLAAGTVNKRLRALSNMYRTLDGRGLPNLVREVDEATEPAPQARHLEYDTIAAVLAALSDQGRAQKDEPRPTFSATKIRLRCLAYSQITPVQLAALTATDLDLERGRLRLPARKKGAGAAAVWVPLLPLGVDAYRDFDARQLYGPFSQSSLRKSWNLARAHLHLPRATPYQLRHSYGVLIYRATKSRQAVQQLMQHARWETSARYAMGAEAEVTMHFGQMVLDHVGQPGGTTTAPEIDKIREFSTTAEPARGGPPPPAQTETAQKP